MADEADETARLELIEQIVTGLARRHSTATALLHHAVSEHLGLGPTDHKCVDLLREHGAMTGSRLAALTGLTTGAVSGVVTRLERAGYLRREPDPDDGRKQLLHPVLHQIADIDTVFDSLRSDMADMLAQFDGHQLSAVASFLAQAADLSLRHTALTRARSRTAALP